MNKNRRRTYSRYSVATGSGWKCVGGAFAFTNTLILVCKVIILTVNDNVIMTIHPRYILRIIVLFNNNCEEKSSDLRRNKIPKLKGALRLNY